jgi:CTP:molybdopterin cytidylyltransferase MocA
MAIFVKADAMVSPVIIVIPGAGASSRMRGGDKLLEPVEGEAMLRRQARIAGATRCPVIVTLPPDRPERDRALAGLDAAKLAVPDAAEGMSASIRQAMGVITPLPHPGVMILPGDMPEMTTEALEGMIAAFAAQPDRIWRGATAAGVPGHPAIFPRVLWGELALATGDRGGIGVIRAHPDRVSLFPLPGAMAVTDLDTPEDWAAWRVARGEGRT